jgi:hypothetical protein
MPADLIAAYPNAAGAFAIAVEDQRLDVMRLHELVLIDAVLGHRAFSLVNVQDARVVGNAGKRFVKCRNRGRKIGGPSREAARADERNAK